MKNAAVEQTYAVKSINIVFDTRRQGNLKNLLHAGYHDAAATGRFGVRKLACALDSKRL